ncbi:MAG TPA: three-Cys-motif partner protein TcmP [Solirubrobacteraceae bacterium]|jgi:three-Cys-motif partner protein|nr:three-Cys-motif partner protein TcmP [Solirubrobacteraceae bacterium]
MAATANTATAALLAAQTTTAAPLGVDLDPPVWPGAKPDELRMAPDGLPARVVKAQNGTKADFIEKYSHTFGRAMKNKWPARAYIDIYAGPGICWVEDTGEFVLGSPLIAAQADPQFTHHVFVDMDSRCTSALEERLAGLGAMILTADSNAPETIAATRDAIPRRRCLSLALLDPQGCTLHLETIRTLTFDRKMDLLINFPVLNLYRQLPAQNWHVLENVLGPDWPRRGVYGGIDGWGFAAREHFRAELAKCGYRYTSAKEVRGEKKNGRLYDFIIASGHHLACDLFEKVTQENRHGQRSLF